MLLKPQLFWVSVTTDEPILIKKKQPQAVLGTEKEQDFQKSKKKIFFFLKRRY